MILIAIFIFSVSTWAVFSKRFCDGLITKHFLIFAAITSTLVVLDPANIRAAYSSVFCFAGGISYWSYKHRRHLCRYLRGSLNAIRH